MESRSIPIVNINYKGKVDWNGVLNLVYAWLTDRKFTFIERKHKSRTDEREILITSDRRITGYIRYYIDVEIRFINIKPTEIETPNGIVQGFEGHLSVDISGKFVADWQKRWGGHEWIQQLDFFFRKFIIHQDLEHIYEDNLLIMVDNLKRELQKFLGMEVFH
ncbi:MAG: hypothetical protein QF486_04020 [Candidatus Woesearchaeota archaeon]|jgi:hypothetical protein|nr:hypothetical protein [Candidatus Woesearchaeota archaeon]MDP7181673.1 hypothetical protein [Candidatus Woesearchaeota archaeon]MDP7198762.1 hypothetical protein [Candidatus Woesearchaeota archaeon]MDP7467238.1 hypothetical protein [Candidatus Woesearchaeota archaeon]MDP7647427.1 hypothetical protein [Candidatus Woesearchaeota archaeon]|tara:strand:+ start:386 stop:874 length:489 start_codon:yes stop_codon:yes gene_type:complete